MFNSNLGPILRSTVFPLIVILTHSAECGEDLRTETMKETTETNKQKIQLQYSHLS